MKRLRVSGTLGGAGPNKAFPFLEVPDAATVFGRRGRIPVVVRFQETTLRMSLAPMHGSHWLGFSGPNAKTAGVAVGDQVTLTLELDEASRAVAAPPALAAALKGNSTATRAWQGLAPSHQREHAEAILDAKKPETVSRRVAQTIAALTAGVPRTPKTNSTKPLAQRLGFKPGMTVTVLNAPRGFTLDVATAAKGGDGALVFVRNQAALERVVPKLERLASGTLWLAYPKTTSGVETDLTRDAGWAPLAALGLHPVTQVSVDAVWSALRVRR
jgi:hypothetical protein